MEVSKAWRVVWCTVWVWVVFPRRVHSDPISIDFSNCVDSTSESNSSSNAIVLTSKCCPLLPTRPIINGVPPPTTSTPRVRMAAQCTDATYAATIDKAYALMRTLPDDDPRSFKRQWELHCAYCGGSFLTYNSIGDANGIDIHFSWIFFPWHRFYLYFHERILQTLLGDPTFSPNYWNWDNPFSRGDGISKDGVCLSRGDNFPVVFNNPSKATYDVNRSLDARGLGRKDFPVFTSPTPADDSPLANATADTVIESNINLLYISMVSGGTTADTFLGMPYRAGDLRPEPNINSAGGPGSLETGPHSSVHVWVGTGPGKYIDMGILVTAARDPVFFSHHGNIDRMWEVWKAIGPVLGQNGHSDHTDPDFLESSFLFYDENKDLRRVKIKDCLDTTKLGYVYQQAPISQWLRVNRTICSTLNYTKLIAAADTLPAPVKDSSGCYELTAGATFTIEILRPNNTKGLEEFLTISGIALDRSCNGGFDVFVDLLDPRSLANPWKCPEYAGRFTNMANSRPILGQKTLVWKQSITKTFLDILAPEGPSTVVISLVSMSKAGSNDPSIYFTDVTIDLGA